MTRVVRFRLSEDQFSGRSAIEHIKFYYLVRLYLTIFSNLRITQN